MDWRSFIIGGLSILITYAMFKGKDLAVESESSHTNNETESDLEVNEFGKRYATMSCQNCRKLKRHQVLEDNLFQCTKCKRIVDARAS